jgi:hypothetical protein
VTLTAADTGGSGLDATYYTRGASPPDPTSASAVYNPAAKPNLADGERIKYFSTDNAGNAEAVKTSRVLAVALPPPPPEKLRSCLGRKTTIVARAGVVTRGTPGADVIVGTLGADRIRSGAGNDRICSLKGKDTIVSGAADDRISAGPGDDLIRTGAGDDSINPGSGGDKVFAGAGNDTLGLVGGARDLGNCGPGDRDTVRADFADTLQGCERRSRFGRK